MASPTRRNQPAFRVWRALTDAGVTILASKRKRRKHLKGRCPAGRNYCCGDECGHSHHRIGRKKSIKEALKNME